MKQGNPTHLPLLLCLLYLFLTGCGAQEVRAADQSVAAVKSVETTDLLLKTALGVDENVNLCEGLVTHQKPVAIKPVQKPPFMQYYREPAFNTRAIRITNSAENEVQKPAYSTMQAWNADESLILLYRTNTVKNDYVLLDGQDYRFVKALDISATDIEQVFWSHTDPATLFYISNTYEDNAWFMRYDVSTGKRYRIRNFESVCPNSMPTSGNGVQMQSLDDDLFGFRCQLKPRHVMFSYRMSTDSIHKVETGEGTPWQPWHAPMPAPSGKRMEIQGRVVPPELDAITRKLDQAVFHEHASLGRTTNGQDALFQTVFDASPAGCDGAKNKGVAHLTEFNLETGSCRPVVSQADGWPYTTSGTHISALARHRPGWVAMSSIGYGNLEFLDGSKPAPPLTSEIYLVNTDPEDTQLCRLAQHRSYGKDAENGGYHPYFGEPHVTISPSGTRLLFGSDWYDSGSVDSYIIELPAHQQQ